MVQTITQRLSFSGHDSFQCRNLWLKKGYDFVKNGKSFNDEDAVVALGVGKNMVTSIRYWMRVFDLLNSDDSLTELAHKLLDDEGYDPYLEDIGSIWLLHYHLVSKAHASTYYLIFNELRREKVEFTKENFLAFVKRKAEAFGVTINDNTVNDDFGVMTKMYGVDARTKDKDDSFSGILTELDLIKLRSAFYKVEKIEKKQEFYIIENTERPTLPEAIVLYGILHQSSENLSLSFNSIEQDPNQVGSVFALNRTGLLNKIEGIVAQNPDIIFSNQAGIKELQFKNIKPNPFTVLDNYYGK